MHFRMLSAVCFSFDQSKMLSSGNGLKQTVPDGTVLLLALFLKSVYFDSEWKTKWR